MKMKHLVLLVLVMLAAVAMPAAAQEATMTAEETTQWNLGIIGAAFAIGIAAAFGALGQAKAVSAACSAMARNPGSAANVRFALILGLALIESLVLYALLIAMRGAGIF